MSWETLLLHASQPFVEFLQVRQKPHLGATVGFVHKIFERAALSHVSRDVAQDHEAPSVRHEFLNDVTRKTCLESEKIVFQPLHWNKDQLGALLDGLANQIQGLTFAFQFLSVWRADENLHTLNRGKRVRHHARLWFAFNGCSDLLFSSVTHFFAQDNVALLCRTCGKSFWQGALKHSQLTISEKNWLMSNLDSGGEVRNDIHAELEYMMF
jgi:hypothetical protein